MYGMVTTQQWLKDLLGAHYFKTAYALLKNIALPWTQYCYENAVTN